MKATRQLKIQVTPEMLAAVEAEARERNISKSCLVRDLLAPALAMKNDEIRRFRFTEAKQGRQVGWAKRAQEAEIT